MLFSHSIIFRHVHMSDIEWNIAGGSKGFQLSANGSMIVDSKYDYHSTDG